MRKLNYVILERLKYHSQTGIAGSILLNMRGEAHLAQMADRVIIQLVTEIAGQKEQLFEVSWPATWLDAAKDRWLRGWLRKRFPPSFKSYRLEKHTLFPSISIPKHDSVIRIERFERSWTEALQPFNDLD